MPFESVSFGPFVLDPQNRQLRQDGELIELNSRYFDALALLAQNPGELISKDQFLTEVWRGVPVTEEVISQCVKTLRRRLGDDASNPRFIETVPKHGYRFIAPTALTGSAADPVTDHSQRRQRFLMLSCAATLGGGMAGVFGGLAYGFAAVSQTPEPGLGAISVLLVVASMTILIATMGGAGVGLGIALSLHFFRNSWLSCVAGGAAGGLLVGAVVKLLGIDAFNLLFGQSPGDVTGAAEGVLLGAAVGLSAWLAGRNALPQSARQTVGISALVGAGAGVVIALSGGRLMVGSLDLLVRQFSGSRLRVDRIGQLFGEDGFGEVTQVAMGGLEGALFAASIAGAILVARRNGAAAS